MINAQDIVTECFEPKTGVETTHWPSIERWIIETVDGIHLDGFRADPFGPSQERSDLLTDSLALAKERFDNPADDSGDNEQMTIPEFIEEHDITITSRRDNPPSVIEDFGLTYANGYGYYKPRSIRFDCWVSTMRFNGRQFTFTYKMGEGHNGKEPDLESALDSLVSDARSWEDSDGDYGDWASQFGYGDSAEHKRTFKACARIARRLKKLFGDELYQFLLYNVEPY